ISRSMRRRFSRPARSVDHDFSWSSDFLVSPAIWPRASSNCWVSLAASLRRISTAADHSPCCRASWGRRASKEASARSRSRSSAPAPPAIGFDLVQGRLSFLPKLFRLLLQLGGVLDKSAAEAVALFLSQALLLFKPVHLPAEHLLGGRPRQALLLPALIQRQ